MHFKQTIASKQQNCQFTQKKMERKEKTTDERIFITSNNKFKVRKTNGF